LAIDEAHLVRPSRPYIVLVDDVFTQGHTFKASQRMLLTIPEVLNVDGLFLTKAIRPPIVWNHDLMNIDL